MVDIAVKPIVLKDCTLTVGADGYQAHVSQVTMTPSSQAQTWQGLTPAATFTDVSTATWVVDLAYAQDWVTPNALSQYLHANEGETVEMTFKPKAGGPGFTVSVIITPGAIGGTVNQFATATVSLPAQGKPVLVPAA